MSNIYGMSDTWTVGGTTYSAIKMDVTDTASAAGSMLLDLRVAGTGIFQVRKDGALLVADGTKAAPSIVRGSASTTGFYFTTQQVVFAHGGQAYWSFDTSRLRGTASSGINWSSGADPTVTGPDTGLSRFSAGVMRICGGEPGSAGGALATGDPTSGDGPAWKFGAIKAAVVALDTANYIEVSVGGVTKKVLIAS